tara:strand:+ start:109 stop:552 length:444 start_codon:yes stop_codon:yes gene_type:complete
MPGKFNETLWNIGRKIEDECLPLINRYFNADFKRDENIFDILDFHDDTQKIICEIKGRTTNANKYKDTIIPYNKVTAGFRKIEEGYRVYFIFCFKDKTMEIELKEDTQFKVVLTGTNSIEHALIPITDLTLVEYPVPDFQGGEEDEL